MSAEGFAEQMGSARKVVSRAEQSPRKSKVPAPPRRGPHHSRAQIVVIEEGALTGALPSRPAEFDETVVVAQTFGETALQLAQRAIHRIAMLHRTGAHVVQVSIFLAPNADQQTMAARRLLGSAVLASANSARRQCELVFGVRDEQGLRQQLWELVELLVTEPGSATVPIRLRFLDQRSPAAWGCS